jgi:hypothetical protein
MEPSMIPNAAPLIPVTTAGKLGAEASRLLAQRGTPVRALVPSDVATSPDLLGRAVTSLADLIGEVHHHHS